MTLQEIKIGKRKIGIDHPPFIVAEMSANHRQSLNVALQIVEMAKQAGAHAIKLQTYTADTMTLNKTEGRFTITDKESPWYERNLYSLYEEAHTPWEWHPIIAKRCQELDLIFFSTPFDATAVDFLETLKVPCYKIASLEITDLPLIRKVASTKKPLIISTGGATLEEITAALTAAKKAGCEQLILLKCTAAYPAPVETLNLNTIPDLANRFQTIVGLSDHSSGTGAAIASVSLGCRLIEKHVTLSRNDGGVDSAFSIEPHELKLLVEESHNAWQALGRVFYGPTKEESRVLLYRRSLFFTKSFKRGEVITKEHVRSLRPNMGISPAEWDQVIGSKLLHDVAEGEPVTWQNIEKGK